MKPWGIALLVIASACIVWTIVRIIKIIIEDSKKKNSMGCDSIIIDGELYNYNFDNSNLHIDNSHKVSKRFFESSLSWIKERHPNVSVWARSMKSLKREWATHNLLYAIDFHRDRTGSVDLNYPQKWYVRLAYDIFGSIALIFIK